MIEGKWSGYSSGQSKIVHREVTKDRKRAEACQKNGCILYTDGTTLDLKVRIMLKGERGRDLINGYGVLIGDCVRYDCWSVNGLAALRESQQ